MKLSKIIKRFRVDKPERFRLADVDPGDTCGIESSDAKSMLEDGVKRLTALQERLYAQDRWALLAVFQAMDAAGKDGVIKHVMSGVNPQGCQVFAFKAPSAQELDHDFLWRTTVCLPERGRIGIFNRSYYEEVLVVRVHPELLKRQRLPEALVTKSIWKERFKDIRAFERHLTRNGTLIRKFHLHVSPAEQRRRFLERLDDPDKRWKFAMSDVSERKLWDRYMEAYEDMIRETSTPEAPWYVIPADKKWFSRLLVAAILVEGLEALDLEFPVLDEAALGELMAARAALVGEEAEATEPPPAAPPRSAPPQVASPRPRSSLRKRRKSA